MRYIPNLIPKKSKVLPDYFKEDIYANNYSNSTLTTLSYIGAIALFIIAFVSIVHPLLSLFFLIPGLCLLPPMNNWIEKRGRFRFTTKTKTGFISIILLCSIPLIAHYSSIDRKQTLIVKAQKEKEEKIALAIQIKDKKRQDSLQFYLQENYNLQKEKKRDKALEKLVIAEKFAVNEYEFKSIRNQRTQIAFAQTLEFVKTGQYKKALPELNNLLSKSPSDPELLYNRAVCLNKTGKTQEAVNDLKTAMKLGNSEAEKLHEKINPIKKRVSYYITLCCDGSSSNAKGRGACSHHGGVCDWNSPVYEEYRKY